MTQLFPQNKRHFSLITTIRVSRPNESRRFTQRDLVEFVFEFLLLSKINT